MDEAKTFNCPKCGASLSATEDKAELECPYCGNMVIVPEELRTPVKAANPLIVEVVQSQPTASRGTGWLVWVIVFAIACPVLVGVVTAIVPAIMALATIRQMASPSNFFPTDVAPALATAMSLATSVKDRTPLPTTTSAPTRTPTTVPSPTITRTPVPAATPFSKIVFQDDFSSPGTWDIDNADNNIIEYVKGGYRIFVGKQGSGETVWIKDSYTDINVQVDAQKVAGPDDSWFGVMCRVKHDVGGYAFLVNAVGNYEIRKYTFSSSGGSGKALVNGALKPNPINATQINQLRADCIGSTLTLYLGDQPLARASDSQYTSGGIGLIAETGKSEEPGIDMLFKHYIVRAP